MNKINIAIIEATELIGQAVIKSLDVYDIAVNNLKLFTSNKGQVQIINFRNVDYEIQRIEEVSFNDIDVAFFCCESKLAKKLYPLAHKHNCLVIDTSSSFSMDPKIPLIVPKINSEDLAKHQGLIANPNCTTIQSVIVLKAILKEYKLKRVNYVTLQAVSGSGQKGVADLTNNSAEFYPYHIKQTCIPSIDINDKEEYTKEEMKMIYETKKILHLPKLPISATCIRVPIINGHGVVIQLKLNKEFTINHIRQLLSQVPDIMVVDDIRNQLYPISSLSRGSDKVYVGRIRKDLGVKNGLLIYCVADNLLRGGGANAVLILKQLCTFA